MITIRRFDPKDQAGARTVVLEGLREHFGVLDPSLNPDLQDIQASFITRGDDFYVAENDGRIVGTAGLIFGEGRARIVRMSVAQSHRKRGIATGLLKQCIESAAQRGFREIWAYTQPEWPDAVSFYLRSGFEQLGRDEIDIHLRLLCASKTHENRDLIDGLRSGRDALLNAITGMTEDVASHSPEAGRWSVLQCVEHVAVAEDYLLSQIAAATHSPAPMVHKERESKILERGIDRTRKIPSPDVARPIGRFHTLSEAVEYFLVSRQRTIDFVENCSEDLRALLTDHPVIGKVNVYEMLLMMSVHPHRHAKQIDEVRSTLGSPLNIR